MNGRKRAQENLSVSYVIIAQFQESISDYSFPLILYLFLLLAYSCKTLEHQSGNSEGSEGRTRERREGVGTGWDGMGCDALC